MKGVRDMKCCILPILIAGALGAAPDVLLHESFRGPSNGGVPEGWEFWTPRPSMKLKTTAAPKRAAQ